MIITHDVTATMVLNGLPFASGTVTTTSAGLNTVIIDEWIEEAAGILNNLLHKHDIDPANLEDDSKALVQTGIKAYARAQALMKRQFSDVQIQSQMSIWNEVKKTIRETPGDLGKAQNTAASIVTNITSPPKEISVFYNEGRFRRF
ncbi:MAG: hypothetical protein ACR2MR_13585 [Dietzia maris]